MGVRAHGRRRGPTFYETSPCFSSSVSRTVHSPHDRTAGAAARVDPVVDAALAAVNVAAVVFTVVRPPPRPG
ncbi:hypothetical protein [Streptomyces sp. C10-9-1]|uniref:hypothetical protein n=1 Tax=Streptomyces sp. C10-9-1 TaxID=1859285 RepID=UPI003D74E12B